jgi:hypothetical protein
MEGYLKNEDIDVRGEGLKTLLGCENEGSTSGASPSHHDSPVAPSFQPHPCYLIIVRAGYSDPIVKIQNSHSLLDLRHS